jgi:hypothetical protein
MQKQVNGTGIRVLAAPVVRLYDCALKQGHEKARSLYCHP